MFNFYQPMTSKDQPEWRNSLEIRQAAYEHEKRLNMRNSGFENEESFQNWVSVVATSFWGKDSK